MEGFARERILPRPSAPPRRSLAVPHATLVSLTRSSPPTTQCPNTTGAELRSVSTEAGMYAIRARRKSVSEKDFLEAVNKVIKGYKKFSSTPKYMVYN
jgi:ATP-dependent 26S proteasome regulatory subunit